MLHQMDAAALQAQLGAVTMLVYVWPGVMELWAAPVSGGASHLCPAEA